MPYNPYLLRLFNYHINVEAVGASRQSSIYLSTFTRVMTGAPMSLREADKEDSEGNIDEIKQYRDAR